MKKKILIIVGIPLLLIVAIGAILVLPWLLIFVGIYFEPNPPRPEVTYGEFPFRLVYEINGEKKIIEDTLICEYDGIGMDEGQGKHRKWKEYLLSGNEELFLLEVDNPASLRSDRKVIKQEIYYPTGSARYYMGDLKEYETYNHTFPDAGVFEQYEGGILSSGIIFSDELLEKYNIKLLSWDITSPIKNNFEKEK